MTPVRSARPGPRSRSSTVRANDDRVVEAAGSITATDGWLGLSPTRVASVSGLSRTAVQARYESDVDIAVAVWEHYASGELADALGSVLRSAGLLDERADEQDLAAALSRLSTGNDQLRAAGELLVIAPFHPVLAAAVDESAGAQVRDWLPLTSRTAPTGQRAYLLNAALGLLLTSRRPGAADLDWGAVAATLADGLHRPSAAVTLPKDRLTHLGATLDFGTGDRTLDALLNATLREVGEKGFDGATTRGIARAAGCSEGFLFSRYPTKLDLFLDATRRQHAVTYPANEAFTDALATKCSPGVAEAVTIREQQHPDFATDRALMLEQWRLGWHEPRLAQAQEDELAVILDAIETAHPGRFGGNRPLLHYAHAHGLGVALLPLLAPECWRLPYYRATVPLNELGM